VAVKYEAADVSNTAHAFQENTAVIKALVAKFPEFARLLPAWWREPSSPPAATTVHSWR